jgi:hypothetical protein
LTGGRPDEGAHARPDDAGARQDRGDGADTTGNAAAAGEPETRPTGEERAARNREADPPA